MGKPNSPYFWENGLLMRAPYNTIGKKLIVLLQSERTKALRMVHHGQIAGHFARDRTLQAIRVRLDWPGIVKDVNDLCASCPICQKSGPALLSKAPLQPLPIIKDPFSRVAMEVFGPLTRTKAGNKYVLVLVDYTSKWPEAYALRNVTTETVGKCLIDMTARVGIPEEILTDNGSNFVSKTMREYCTTMGIEQIKTSPYHPQTDGMVERFNATLKRLLRKITQNPKVEWDECLPYVLWAYRGTVHKTTGFSPYQMSYGRPMRMPPDQMVRYWRGKEEQGQNTTIEFVETLKANIQVVRDLAYEKEIKEKESQKFSHDRKSVVRNFDVGEYVLVFRPIRKSKLENQWQGPYIISKKLTEVTYQVDLGTFGKRYRTFHVNCMRKWTSPNPAAFMALDEEDLNHEKEEHPIVFGSKKLLPREINYSAIEREALAIVKGIQQFRTYLEGTSFKIETDHNPLTHLSTLKDSHGRLARWALTLQPYDFRIVHSSGKANANADGLSRDQRSLFKEGGMSEIETLTGEDTTERGEMALGQPITSREQSPERTLQERKLQNNVIVAAIRKTALNSNRASDNYTLYLFT